MKILNSMKLWMIALGLFTASCGTGIDPIGVAVGNGSIPQLGPIVSTATGTTLTSGYSSASPFWTFGFTGFTGSYLAPADGVVTQIGTTTINGSQTNYVTLIHTGGRLASRFFGVQQVIVRVGDSVATSQPIGVFNGFTLNGVQFQVLLDSSPVCPLSFLSDAFKQSYVTWIANNPCL